MTLIKGLRPRVIPSAFDPATLPLAVWYRDYSGTAYAGKASTGTSGSKPGTVSVAPTPTAGALSGNPTSVWTGGSGSNITTSTTSSSMFSSSATSGFISCLINASVAAGSGTGSSVLTTGQGIWTDTGGYGGNGAMGMYMLTTGPSCDLYSGAHKTITNTTVGTTGVWLALFMWWDGTNLYFKVNNTTTLSVPCGSPDLSANTTVVLGRSYAGASTSFGGSMAEWMSSASNLSTSITDIYSYYKTRYPAAGLP